MALRLLFQLPESSRFVGKYRGGDEHIGWTGDRYLNTAMVDLLNQILYVLMAANSKRKPKPPKPTWTPDRKRRKQEDNAFAQSLKMEMDKLREG